jgi:hypothetical protein
MNHFYSALDIGSRINLGPGECQLHLHHKSEKVTNEIWIIIKIKHELVDPAKVGGLADGNSFQFSLNSCATALWIYTVNFHGAR